MTSGKHGVRPTTRRELGLFHLLSQSFRNCVEEMGTAVARSAFSSLLQNAGDASAAVFTHEGDLIAVAERRLVHVATLGGTLAEVLKRFEDVADGDVFVDNDPYYGGVHANDVAVIRPIFSGGRLVFWAATVAHVTDLGGAMPGGVAPQATEIWHEGLRIPPIKLYEGGRLSRTAATLVEANSRLPGQTLGDIHALVAGTAVGATRLTALLDSHGREALQAFVVDYLDYSESRTRDCLARLKEGSYAAECWMDDDGVELDRRFRIRATVTVHGRDLTIDLSGTDPQARGAINSSRTQTMSAIMYAVRCYLDHSIPTNQGCWRPLKIVLPRASLVDPNPPAPCSTRMAATVPAVVEAVLWAMAPSAPSTFGSIAGSAVASVQALSPARPDDYWIHFEPENGGMGARNCKDGIDAVGTHLLGTSAGNIPIEVSEVQYPVLYERYELRRDSGGPGQFRGGLGTRKDVRVLSDCLFSGRTDRERYPPRGRLGGSAGAGAGYVVNAGRPDERRLPSKVAGVLLRAGDVVSVLTAGGGGFGAPLKRELEMVVSDLKAGRVSVEAALSEYGVRVDQRTLGVDLEGTARERKDRDEKAGPPCH